jgi:capsular polysaccharide biosynthesis protein
LSAEWGGAILHSDAKVLEVDVPLAAAIQPNLVYGHFLLEVLPRLHLLSRLRRCGVTFSLAVPTRIPGWAKRVINLYFDDEEVVFYDPISTRVRSPCFIVPSMMHTNYYFHPDFNLAVDELKDFVSSRSPKSEHRKIWLSRTRSRKGWRGITNIDEVERTVASLGFEVVHPQEMTFPEQIVLMDGADCIASEFSSAVHNSLFARRGTKVFCINRINWYQSGIAALRSQPLAYMMPADGYFRDWRIQGVENHFEVDCSELRSQLVRFQSE